jgi:hypothetical protein
MLLGLSAIYDGRSVRRVTRIYADTFCGTGLYRTPFRKIGGSTNAQNIQWIPYSYLLYN